MISRISKSITTALLLVVGFSGNSHCMNSMFYENSVSIINNINAQTNMFFNNMSKQMDMLFNNMNVRFNNVNTQMDRLFYNMNAQMDMLFNDMFTNNSNHMLSCFASWNNNILKEFNSVLYQPNVKPYVIQWRTEPKLNNINGTQQSINYRQVQNSFRNNNAAYRQNIVNLRQNNFRIRNYTSGQYNNFFNNNYYNYNNRQVQNTVTRNNNANTIGNSGRNVFSRIVNNLEAKHEVDKNVKQFFDNYIGNDYNKIFYIFNINDNKKLHDINLILLYNEVQDYLSIGSIKKNLITDIREMHKLFFKGVQDPSNDRIKPVRKEEFRKAYLNTMQENIKIRIDKIKNIKYYINCTNANTQTKRNIKTLLNKCVQNREKYLNDILKKITNDNHVNKVYKDYLSYYKTNSENIVNNNIPKL